MRPCPHCGSPIENQVKVCPDCGELVSKQQPAAPPPIERSAWTDPIELGNRDGARLIVAFLICCWLGLGGIGWYFGGTISHGLAYMAIVPLIGVITFRMFRSL